ncbi:MAG TPA: KpsF/GutQ family sugar-phosphate isomerase [Arachidicoccus sp.]|nr:KpsF/GutQ family sugar-phosphate isomerase [Arachidicoccus sp.]
MEKSIIQIATEVILAEQAAIGGLLPNINTSFEKTIDLLWKCKGRIIISGIGKSAIIAQKIVATLNSTGASATFLHAADAIHGDLGMVRPADVAILISNSGESAEIKVLAPLIRQNCTALVALVGNNNSFLARHSDYVLCSGIEKEACPNNLAPTSSTTAQLVMGDAIAVCLMELNRFAPADFARLHPGGDIGKRLHLRVAELYIQNGKPAVQSGTDLKSVILEISKGRMGATAVTDDQGLVTGIITDGDVRRMLERTDRLTGIVAADILSADPKTITPDMLAINAMEIIKKNDVGQLIVRDDHHHFLGFLHLHDLIREGIY